MILNKPKFWDYAPNKLNFLKYLFFPASLVVEVINFFKNKKKKEYFKIKTICVGNIYIGGTGKTPMAILLNQIISEKLKCTVVKKFYSSQIDEQKLISHYCNLICKSSRTAALKIAEQENFDVAILDDGLQEKKINKDLSIVCFNSDKGIGNGSVIPSGPLRENIKSLANYNIALINGENDNENLIKLLKLNNESIQIFRAKYEITNIQDFDLNKDYYIFSGIGNNESFYKTLEKNNFKIKKYFKYPDHYNYSTKDIHKIKNEAQKNNLTIITTEKDYLRLNNSDREKITFIKIKLKILHEKKFIECINKYL
mgnify:CR=1 FL=1|tara:strand:+ start:3888 stop:4823 length:936 start_codon:yes stop_codon:yes gene_type:complete